MKAADHLIHTTEIGGDLNSDVLSERIKVYTSSWSGNFNSWKSFKSNEKYLLIKYEDLITDREATLKKVLKFIYKLKNINFEINNIKLKNVIETTDFEYMKKLENKKGFIEGKINKKTSAKIPFFNLGPKNDWKILLNLEIIKKIEKAFGKEMKELGYL